MIANDAESKRAYMLTHQMNRLNTSSIPNYKFKSYLDIVVVNHFAQNFPTLYYKDPNQGS